MERRQPVVWASLSVFTRVCRAVGHKQAASLGEGAANIVRVCSPGRASRARSRAARMLGVSDRRAGEIIKAAYSHFGRALAEFIRLPIMYPKIDEIVSVTGEEHIWKALELGR
ncbi:MAG: hypothetical protein LBL36_05750, partial [Clostridiales Family XIII bacterium]|nr:hypothetical protein [Clostridiales Family XIII bacterium]